DQRVVAGLGNIYVAESLWLARIDPRRAANTLGARRLSRLVEAIRAVLQRASRPNGRYRGESVAGESLGGYSERFMVYDREGEPCPRCGRPVRRITQAARSTYFCAFCQRA
ncbi:MAG: zinc finger domain-containing protein, partial [Gemmatimonadaceae bacterium]